MNLPSWQVEAKVMKAIEGGRQALASRLAQDGINLDEAAAMMNPAASAKFNMAVQQMIQTRGRLGYAKAKAALRGA